MGCDVAFDLARRANGYRNFAARRSFNVSQNFAINSNTVHQDHGALNDRRTSNEGVKFFRGN